MRSLLTDLQRDNPFDLTKASDYSDRQVQEYWVDVGTNSHSLVDLLKPKSLVPMLLLGGKGSGKTHLMRYCSSTVQELRHKNLREAIIAEQYLGVYTNADGLNVYRFAGKGQCDDVWATVFAYSFELWLAGCLLACLRPAVEENELLSPEWNREISRRVLDLMHIDPSEPVCSFDDLMSHLKSIRNGVDVIVNNSAITRSLDGISITFNPGDLVFGITKIVSELCEFAKNTVFVYLVDEVENFTEQQQKFLNSLIRYRKGNATLRIGARLYGIKTRETLGSGEPIKRDAEFESVFLDAQFRENQSQYEKLAARLVLKRLEPLRLPRVMDESNLLQQFAEQSSGQYYQEISLQIVRARDANGKERPHLARFRRFANRVIGDENIVGKVIDNLSINDHPLLEKLNLLAFYKRLSKGCDVIALAGEIRSEADALISGGSSAAPAYYDLYSHFSSDLLAQLYRDYGRKPVYAGFKTMVRLSQGVPRNLLSLLKHIYRRSQFAGEEPFIRGPISVDSQAYGIQDAAEWFWEDAQPDSHGTIVRSAVEHIATLLRSVRYSDNPPECDLCSFQLNREKLSENAQRALKMAENWSFVLSVSGSSGAKNDDRILSKFQVNPMLAARWGISESRRGVLELKEELAECVLGGGSDEEIEEMIKSRVDDLNLPRLLEKIVDSQKDSRQTGLFDGNE
ncbi:hypothetical protein QZM46_23515 [Burkholderia vietnamiensis]|uniref:ORC-CDC6 family AAA ATPase n=1 Tax=Burkholderia vietnamiensis TaxID=60552 RepID=UPI0026540FB8|nr:hypothetical protein [Burkholderia vietnamiensis]MDN7554287.1 hypothetical protein [Burkholderia vietnamiensis]HDR9091997.1 hypothetical protein [Burkholderia vietnamiensis]